MAKQFPEAQVDFMNATGQHRFHLVDIVDTEHWQQKELRREVSGWNVAIDTEINRELRAHLVNWVLTPITITALNKEKLAVIAQDIANSIYVLCGLANTLDLPLTEVFTALHQANLVSAVNTKRGVANFKSKLTTGPGNVQPNIIKIITRVIEQQKQLAGVTNGSKSNS